MQYNINLFPENSDISNAELRNKNEFNTIYYNDKQYEFIDGQTIQDCYIDIGVTYITCNFRIYQQFRDYLPIKYCPFQYVTHIDEIDSNIDIIDKSVTYDKISTKLLDYCKKKYVISDEIVIKNHSAIDVYYKKCETYYHIKESKTYSFAMYDFFDSLKLAINNVNYLIDDYYRDSNVCNYITDVSVWLGLTTKYNNGILSIYNLARMDIDKFNFLCSSTSDYFEKYIITDNAISKDATFSGLMSEIYEVKSE